MNISSTIPLNNGIAMPLLGLGTWRAAEGGEVERSILAALELGYRHIDTAAVYGNETGVGKAIRESGLPRAELFVTTKLWNDDQGYDSALTACRASLERLGLDYVDLYLVHWPVRGKLQETWAAMEQILGEGLVRAIGVSNFHVHHLQLLLEYAKTVPAVNQVEFHPWLQQRELRAFCREQGIVVEAWSPLAKGRIFDQPLLQEIAAAHGKHPAQILIRWDLQLGVVTIPKSVHRERLAANGDVFDFTLSDDELERIADLDQGERVGPDPDSFAW